jgi:predicted O-methyltransferase YrrM
MIKEVDFKDKVSKYTPYPKPTFPWMMNDYGRKVVYTLVIENKKNKTFFEFGTWRGIMIKFLQDKIQDREYRYYTLDCPKSEEIQFGDPTHCPSHTIDERLLPVEIGECCRKDGTYIQYTKDSKKWVVPEELKGTIDVVFVDGSHRYDYVKNDHEKALTLVRKGGIIVHDNVNEDYLTDPQDYIKSLNEDDKWTMIKDTGLCFRRY